MRWGGGKEADYMRGRRPLQGGKGDATHNQNGDLLGKRKGRPARGVRRTRG